MLPGRKQKVINQGSESDGGNVKSSIVQGSVLGPVCSLMYMNDMECHIDNGSVISMFADDTKLLHPVATEEDIDIMQRDINYLHSWAEMWQMKYNADKCSVMHVGFHIINTFLVLRLRKHHVLCLLEKRCGSEKNR